MRQAVRGGQESAGGVAGWRGRLRTAPDGDFVAAAPGETQATADAGGGIRLSEGNSVVWGRAQIPSGSGCGNARSVSRIQSVLACGGTLGGVRLLSAVGFERAIVMAAYESL